MDPIKIQRLTKRLSSTCETVRKIADKDIAHLDRDRHRLKPLKSKTLDRAVDTLGKALEDAYLLLTQKSMLFLEPEEQVDWEWVFYKPWLTPVEYRRVRGPTDRARMVFSFSCSRRMTVPGRLRCQMSRDSHFRLPPIRNCETVFLKLFGSHVYQHYGVGETAPRSVAE